MIEDGRIKLSHKPKLSRESGDGDEGLLTRFVWRFFLEVCFALYSFVLVCGELVLACEIWFFTRDRDNHG